MQSSFESTIVSHTPDATLRLGIAGCSLARPRYGAAFALSPRVRIIALADPDTKFIRAWSRILGGEIELFPGLRTMMASKTTPDALVIDVPLAERAEAILAAIPLCRGILCAPPFAATLEETDRILHAAAAHNTWLAPAFPRRFDPILAHAIELANTGEIGLIQQIRCDWSFPLAAAYGAEIGADPDAGTWAALLQYAACHAADVCRWCFGDVMTVSADVDDHVPMSAASGRRDTMPLLANLVLGQEDGPATCHFSRSRAVTAAERYSFTGSLGQLEVVLSASTQPVDAFPAMTLHRPGIRPQSILPPQFIGAELPAPVYRMRAMLDDFAGRVQSGAPPGSTGDGARAALEVVHAAYFSARDSRKVTLPLRQSPAL